MGGFGSAIIEFMINHNYSAKVKRLGIPDKFINHGTQNELYVECGYDKVAIKSTVDSLLIKETTTKTG